MSEATVTTIKGRRIIWQSRDGAVHYGEGADVHPYTRLLWTRCGQHDIPADSAWLQRQEDKVNCPGCLMEDA